MSSKEKKAAKNPFAAKTLKSGSYSLVLCAVVVVIAVLINMIVAALPTKITEPDISANRLFTLSDYSVQVVKGLKTDVTVYQLATESGKDTYVSKLLDRYADLSSHIKVELRDPEVSQIATQYTKDQVSENSLIFVSEKRSKVVDHSSLYGYSDEAMNNYYYGGSTNPDEFNGEQEITSAISFVTTDVLPKAYTLTGHGEVEFSDSVVSSVASQNIELETLDLMTEKSVPEDCACLVLYAPNVDLTDKELSAILDYLDNGGRLLTATISENNLKAAVPNFNKLLLNCGVKFGKGFLVEGDGSSFTYSPTYLLPQIDSHEITDPIEASGYHICLPVCANLQVDPAARSALTVTPILHTSDDAFSRVDTSIESAEKAESDLDGPFDTAFAVTSGTGDKEMRAVIVASPFFLDDNFTAFAGNINLLLNSLKWMCDLEENISVVEVKSLSSGGTLEMDESIGAMWMVICTLVLPVSVLCVGIVIYVRRKKR